MGEYSNNDFLNRHRRLRHAAEFFLLINIQNFVPKLQIS